MMVFRGTRSTLNTITFQSLSILYESLKVNIQVTAGNLEGKQYMLPFIARKLKHKGAFGTLQIYRALLRVH